MYKELVLLFLLCFILNGILCKKKDKRLNKKEGEKCSYGRYNGTCVKYYRCLSVVESVKHDNLPPLCLFDGMDPVLCCPDCELTYDASMISECIDYLSTLPYDCKQHTTVNYFFEWNKKKKCTSYRMTALAPIGGNDASRNEFPHMALLGYGENLEVAEWKCAGSLISEKFVLTAAHCISSPQLGPVRYIGLGILKRSDPSSLWQRYGVRRIIPHPEYNSPKKYYDIALLETDRPVNFSEVVLPACLHTPDEKIYYPQVHATGWGYLGYKKPLADTLQKVDLQKFSTEECSLLYGPHRHLPIGFDNISQMCFGHHTKARDTCAGDSGGPLEVYVNLGCQYSVLGVTSSGIECGTAGTAGLYTRVTNYLQWIESIVWP
ncbi:hypothetical protein K1T71_014682 [Dendrolimus kikuchii]|uniref:Uncharacterized protein n=1 Tax=Dendrolimus kikuchii TaxID=765133 RepID=A0ACC1CF21_9NEOP|nr:hypothetical protein K1T71_014682 [Dendrolimus kikuchii]